MRWTMLRWSLAVALAGGLLSLSTIASAQQTEPEAEPVESESTLTVDTQAANDETASTTKTADPEKDITVVNLFDGIRAGVLTAKAEGREDGDMTISISNRSRRQLRVVLPPGLIATGATGQFGGGMGGRGGRGGGMGGMGMGGMGMGGMGGGMGGMGMGGMGGGMGGMGMGGGMGGGMMGGGLVMPAPMGMMMLGMMIMQLVGETDSWDMTSLMMGGMGMMGGGMGMMGGMGGGMMGGMGGMGMMGGGMMGGFRSLPPTDLPSAAIQPGQTRNLATHVVSLSPPVNGRVVLPAKGEPLQLGDISQLTDNPKVQLAKERLDMVKAPTSVTQLVLWHLLYDADWAALAQVSRSWANSYELALARQFVARLDGPKDEMPPLAAASLYLEIQGQHPLSDDLRKVLDQSYTLGLTAELGVPARPDGPALACKVQLDESQGAQALVYSTDATGKTWTPMGKFDLPIGDEMTAEELADGLAEGILGRLVRAQLTPGKKVKGKDTFKIRIDNASPLILNGLTIAGLETSEESTPSTLLGFAISPRRSLTLPATGEMVERLGLENGVRVVLADLSGL